MKNRIPLLGTAILAVLMAASVVAWPQQSEAPKSQTHKRGEASDHGMMMECHENMQSIRQSNDKLKATIQEAKESNDPAKMRAALDDAGRSIDSMDSHMDKCMSIMQDMHGKGMEHQHVKGMSNEQKKPSTTPPPK